MKVVESYVEASDMLAKTVDSHIDYRGSRPEEVSGKFRSRYGVESIYVEDENLLMIPCTPEIEEDFCYTEEKMQEVCDEMGLNVDDFEF